MFNELEVEIISSVGAVLIVGIIYFYSEWRALVRAKKIAKEIEKLYEDYFNKLSKD